MKKPMLTEPKTIIYPGAHGQAAYCHYQIALSKDLARPTVLILLWHEKDYTGTVVVNSGFSCDNAINRILKQELSGLSFYDLHIFYRCDLAMESSAIHAIPFEINWNPASPWWRNWLMKLGFTEEPSPTTEQLRCGNSPVRTSANVPVSPEESREIASLFPSEQSGFE